MTTNPKSFSISESGELYQTEIGDCDGNLLREITEGWKSYMVAAEPHGEYHLVFNEKYGRGGVVYVGSGSSGLTSWSDADSPEDLLQRFLNDDLRN